MVLFSSDSLKNYPASKTTSPPPFFFLGDCIRIHKCIRYNTNFMFLPDVEEKIHPARNRAGRTMCNPQREMNAAGVNNKSTNGSFISTPSASVILPYLHVHNPPHKTVVWTARGPWTKVAVGFLIGWLTCHRTNLCHESCQPPCTCRVVLHTQRTRCCETERNCAVCALGSYSVPNHATGRVVPP